MSAIEFMVCLSVTIASSFSLLAFSNYRNIPVEWESRFAFTGSIIVMVYSVIGSVVCSYLQPMPIVESIFGVVGLFSIGWLGFSCVYGIGGGKWFEVKTMYNDQCRRYDMNINDLKVGQYVVTTHKTREEYCYKFHINLHKVVTRVDQYGSFNVLDPILHESSHNAFTEADVRNLVKQYMSSMEVYEVDLTNKNNDAVTRIDRGTPDILVISDKKELD